MAGIDNISSVDGVCEHVDGRVKVDGTTRRMTIKERLKRMTEIMDENRELYTDHNATLKPKIESL